MRFGARDYDPAVGRWTQKDARGFGGGTNFYAYCANDPVNLVDPNGREPVTAQDMLNELQPWWVQESKAILLTATLVSAAGLGEALGALVDLATQALAPTATAAAPALVNAAIASEDEAEGVATPFGLAVQDRSPAALTARDAVESGAPVYRIGTTGISAGPEGQFWALENPANPGYAANYGIPRSQCCERQFHRDRSRQCRRLVRHACRARLWI